MVKRVIAGTCLMLVATVLTAAAQPKGCETKKQNIQRQIDYAQQFHNENQVEGLKIALKEVELHCNDASLKAEAKADVEDRKAKVAKASGELDKARQKGDEKAIDRKTKKLQRAQERLQEAEQKLKEL